MWENEADDPLYYPIRVCHYAAADCKHSVTYVFSCYSKECTRKKSLDTWLDFNEEDYSVLIPDKQALHSLTEAQLQAGEALFYGESMATFTSLQGSVYPPFAESTQPAVVTHTRTQGKRHPRGSVLDLSCVGGTGPSPGYSLRI